ncbi:hypothetical protein SAMN05444000_1089 [Shimia gijangensis]|uniref:Uncharacterized protein n=1 Tax=Shimia gijangensis TaxID=1470563 RepID=A0A1M6ITU1_9RHOB|nr:hypothetical protein SAMN05444000_1089 [Shimia gijangensis]
MQLPRDLSPILDFRFTHADAEVRARELGIFGRSYRQLHSHSPSQEWVETPRLFRAAQRVVWVNLDLISCAEPREGGQVIW